MRCRGFNHQIAAKRSFCDPCPGICRCTASGGDALPRMRQNGLVRWFSGASSNLLYHFFTTRVMEHISAITLAFLVDESTDNTDARLILFN